MSLENCPRCGRLFAKNFRDVCPVCMRDIDKEYELCSQYLREHKGAIISELSEQTGVSIKQITKFVREGRISMVDAPNMSYPCESCGVLIRENHLCDSCRAKFMNATKNFGSSVEKGKLTIAEQSGTIVKGAYKGLDQYKNR